MQILIPISGHSSFFPKDQYYFPKPLIEISGCSMIELVVSHLKSQIPNSKFIFVADSDDLHSFSLGQTLTFVAGQSTEIVEKPAPTAGGLCSCLLAVDALDLGQPLIISNSDQIIDYSITKVLEVFTEGKAEAGVLTFDSVHPRWSYIVDDGNGNVLQAFEKRVASRNAIAGLYYYRSAASFIEAAKKVILNDDHLDGSFYISPSLNQIILSGGRVRHFSLSNNCFHSFYSPSKLEEFERSACVDLVKKGIIHGRHVNVVIPAAGEGSRFVTAGWQKPKPFIDLEGQPMLNHIIDNVTPKESSVTLLLRKSHMEAYPAFVNKLEERGHRITTVPNLTEGTACTVLLARESFDNDQPMMVANSDQLVDFDVNAFVHDCFVRELDGSILVFRDPLMDPKWSFVKMNDAGLVTEVAEKMPISEVATVGIYLFARGHDFVNAALDMMLANDRVNNEFYTCPVYNYMIRKGACIGVYEVPMQAMAGLGTPEDLQAFLANRGAPDSSDMPNQE